MTAFLTSFRPKKSLKVLFVTSEAAPFARVGGIASVLYSLPKALSDLGYDARVMLPRYLSISNEKYDLKMEYEGLKVPTDSRGAGGAEHIICNVKRCDPDARNGAAVTTYFLENQEYYEQRANVYGYVDDPIRFALLARGSLEFLRQSAKWVPDIIVAIDWELGLIPNYLKTVYKDDVILSRVASNFSIHNLYFQGNFDHRFVSEMDYDDGHSVPSFFSERLPKLNMMRRGIMYADTINTVSPNYAREIMTKEYGELLDDLLRERRAVLSGILNGIDYDISNPKTNPHVSHPFDESSLATRVKIRQPSGAFWPSGDENVSYYGNCRTIE
jgi:starch synthase